MDRDLPVAKYYANQETHGDKSMSPYQEENEVAAKCVDGKYSELEDRSRNNQDHNDSQIEDIVEDVMNHPIDSHL